MQCRVDLPPNQYRFLDIVQKKQAKVSLELATAVVYIIVEQ
jgi:hypothetical protein